MCCGGPAFSNPLRALEDGSGNHIHRVVCLPESQGPGRTCVSDRALWSYNAAEVYRTFAREVALSVADRWDPPEIVLRFLRTGAPELREKAAAATETCYGATDVAACYAAHEAAVASPRLAAQFTAKYAAESDDDLAGSLSPHTLWRKHDAKRLAQLLTAGRRIYGQRQVP